VIVSIALQQLRCNTEQDSTRPYLWPLLLKLDDETRNTGLVTTGQFAPTPLGAQAVIKDGMRTGDTAAIPGIMAWFSAQFDPGETTRNLILVALLWDARDTPFSAVLAGYEAYVEAVRAAVQANLLALATAPDPQPVIAAIEDAVRKQVEDAITSHLSLLDKIEFKIGLEHPDQLIASRSTAFVIADANSSQAFTLSFGAGTQHDYQVDCRRVTTSDPCEAQLIRVESVRRDIENIEKAVKQLIAKGERKGVDKQIEALDAELQAKLRVLKTALADLGRCRTIHGLGDAGSGLNRPPARDG
jgi:hypothetical protein